MIQRKISKGQNLKLLNLLAVVGIITIFEHSALAQVTPDRTLGIEQSVVTSSTRNGSLHLQIEGGAIRGGNLFHSFRDFNIDRGQSLYFQNLVGVRNIISRVTGGNPSNIEGTLGVSGSTANVFLLNPSGIVFGANARLDIGGSFVATTAPAIQFGDQGFFSSLTPDSPPLLTVDPSAFAFNQVNPAPIVNRSTASLTEPDKRGLQVPDGRSLLLLGGNIDLAGGGVNAPGGRVELGAIAGTGIVEMSLNDNDLRLSFPATLDRADISLTNGATAVTSGEGGGSIQIWGRHVSINGDSQVAAITEGAEDGGNLTVDASGSLEVIGAVQYGTISTLSFGGGKAGDLTIETRRLTVLDGAQIFTGTIGSGLAGQLTINASESVEVLGRDTDTGSSSNLASFTGNAGQAGNLTVNTRRLIIRDGGALSAESLVASEDGQVFPVSGDGGNLTINASDSIELTREGFIFTGTQSSGSAGNLTINTDSLVVQDESKIGAQSQRSGDAGNIVVRARSIILRNQSQIDAATAASQGGNITLQIQDFLMLQQGSTISTTAGTAQARNGGNINIDADSGFIISAPNENNDIIANAFEGSGGRITLSTQGIYGFDVRTREDLQRLLNFINPLNPQRLQTNDITAFSQANPAIDTGSVAVQTPDFDPTRGLAALPTEFADSSQLIAATCPADEGNSFAITGRGGLPEDPRQPLMGQVIWEDERRVEEREERVGERDEVREERDGAIAEAQGWAIDRNGTVVLVAQQPYAHQSVVSRHPSCAASSSLP